ncbi:hypothetical protein UFOVP46_144 [uncultured Caudovirales phage]|uniref:Uncharacterized protein n=1 Tax=uncultured Caudovirales phage TaxID=2100421 RepID=A0A6J5KQ10_9CAUD|nr:hypothetical protein UFOVP46_144 [uncultured Caudovirales phage]
MATTSTLVNRVRAELGDLGKSFVTQFVADGTTNRFSIHYSPLDSTTVYAWQNGVDVTSSVSVEESTGVIVFDTVPADGDEITVSGMYYRYFTAAELTSLVNDAFLQHSAGHTDVLGRAQTLETLPPVEEYPVALYATTLALYTLANDAAFDIDIQAPDGVSIPRAERYRQLMEMVNVRQSQYRELCTQLGVGLYRIDVFSLRRVSKATGRYVPEYKPQEVDDRSYPQRAHVPMPTYGDVPAPWPSDAGELTAYQGRSFSTSIDFAGDYTGKSFLANLLNQRGSVLAVQNITLVVDDNGDNTYTATLSLTKDQTLRLAGRTYWSLSTVDDTTNEQVEIKGGNFFTQRVSEVIL